MRISGGGVVFKHFAFTLAEVLITLGIIGVVAALTMPTLVANYQKQVLVNQLKKSYSLWSQTFQKILVDDGAEKLSDTQLWRNFTGYSCDSNSISPCGNFFSDLKKYINVEDPINEKNEYKGAPGNSVYNFKTSDGTLTRNFLFSHTPYTKDTATCDKIKEFGGNMCSYIAYLVIDVNGYKKPNTIGRDIFGFDISDDGRLYPKGGKDYALYSSQVDLGSNGNYWRNADSYVATGCEPEKFGVGNFNFGCTARIMEDGWKMNY